LFFPFWGARGGLKKKDMKKITIIAAFAGLLLFSACKPETLKDFIPYSGFELANLQGTWKITKITQTDEDAKRKDFPFKTLDLTPYLNLSAVTLTFNTSGTQPSTFTVNYGSAPQVFNLTSGSWNLDNIDKPGNLSLINGTDTTKFVLGSYNLLPNKKLLLKQTKYLGTTPMISYEYEFSKN